MRYQFESENKEIRKNATNPSLEPFGVIAVGAILLFITAVCPLTWVVRGVINYVTLHAIPTMPGAYNQSDGAIYMVDGWSRHERIDIAHDEVVDWYEEAFWAQGWYVARKPPGFPTKTSLTCLHATRFATRAYVAVITPAEEQTALVDVAIVPGASICE